MTRPEGEEEAGRLEERYLQALPTVTLWTIPLDDDLPKVQQEDISSVKTVPAHFHLQMRSRHCSGGILRYQVERP